MIVRVAFARLPCQDLVEPILVKGANPLAVNGVGICALHYTCFSDSLSLEAAEALLWKGADPSVAEATYGCTPLHYAASSGDVDLCTLLLEHGAQPQVFRGPGGWLLCRQLLHTRVSAVVRCLCP